MSNRKIFAIGLELPDVEGFEVLPLNTDRSFLDADIVCIEPSLGEFESDQQYNGRSLLNMDSSVDYRDSIKHWNSQVATALSAGKLIIIFLLRREDKFAYTGQSEISGTGRSSKTVNWVDEICSTDYIPLKLLDVQYAQGKSMVLSSSAECISDYWKRFSNKSQYNCYFDAQDMQPLVLTRSGRKVVGAMKKVAAGCIILLPELVWDVEELYELDENSNVIENEHGEEKWTEQAINFTREFRDKLFAIETFVTQGREKTAAPEWVQEDKFRLKTEDALGAEIHSITENIQNLLLERDKKKVLLEQEGSLRALLFEKGTRLEEAVRKALEILGFQTEHFKRGESEFDALFTSEDGRFLGEIEGKDSKPLNVDKISQLQRNLIEDFAREEVTVFAHGVLFGNAHRFTKPDDRDDCFTNKVQQVAKQANIALVNTVDLFTAARYIKNAADDTFARECRRAIISMLGKVVVFPDVPGEQTEHEIVEVKSK